MDLKAIEKENMERVEEFGIFSERTMEWLKSIGYFTAPAAIRHHSNYPGGLVDHSIAVTEELVRMSGRLELWWPRKESPYIVGLLHDICKTDEYIRAEDVYIYNRERMYTGHGEASVAMIEAFAEETGEIKLYPTEDVCIRYHMGAFTEPEEWGAYTAAVRRDQNVLFVHTADMIASQCRGI